MRRRVPVSRALVVPCASRGPNRRVFRRSQIFALGTAYLLIYRLGSSSLRSPLAFALRNSATLSPTSYSHGRPALSLLRVCTALSETVLCQLRSGAPSNPSVFQRYPCSHYGRLRVVQPFRGLCPPAAHALRARNTSSISLKQLLCKLFPLCHLAHLPTLPLLPSAAGSTGRKPCNRKPLGHLPSPEDGPRTPTGQSLASENAPFGAVPRAAPRWSRSLITAGRSLLCSASRCKA